MRKNNLRKKVVYGITGCGTAAKAHATAILKNKESVLKAVFDINRHKAEKFSEKYGCEIKHNLSDLLNDKNIHAIIICTPHDTHTNMIIKTIESGKFCITEKPLYLSEKDLIAVEKVASSKKIIVVLQVRFHEPIRFLLESIKNGGLGKIRFCSITVRKNRDKKYFSNWHGIKKRVGGMLLNQGMHGLDLMLQVCGTPLRASGLVRNIRKLSEVEDLYVGHVQSSSGAIGNIEITTCIRDEKPENSILVIGSKGSIKIGGGIFDNIKYAHFDEGKKMTLPRENDGNGHSKFLLAVNDYILLGKKHPLLPLVGDGIRANKFARMLYKNIYDC